MKHRQNKRRFGRSTAHRQAMFRNLVTSLIVEERIETTHAKAKELKRLADKMVTLGKNGSLHSRRRAAAVVRDKDAVRKLFSELAERFAERPGGYVRVTPIGQRLGDAASMAVIEFVQEEYHPRRRRRRRRRKSGADAGEAASAVETTEAASPEASSEGASEDAEDVTEDADDSDGDKSENEDSDGDADSETDKD